MASDVVISDDPADPDDLDEELSRLEQAEIQGPGEIHILVRWHRRTGQTHVAADLTFTTPGGTLRFEPPTPSPDSETSSGEEASSDYPLMERILPAGPNRWVVLGWSSHGEGMQTQRAWLIEDGHGPQILDSLAWTTDRSHGGFAIDPSAKQVRIGIPLPQMPGADGEPHMHQRGAWVLEHGKQQLDLEAVPRLPSSEMHVMALRDYYDPPFQDEPSLLHWSGTFVWFSSGTRFALETPPTIIRPPAARR